MYDIEKMKDALLRADAAGDIESARALARQIRIQTEAEQKPEYDALADTSNTGKFFAGMGKRLLDIGTLGLREQPPSDKALMQDPWAMGGAVGMDVMSLAGGGRVLQAGATAANMPRAARTIKDLTLPNTLPKAVASGGLYGGATTPGDASERLKAAGYSAAGGGIVPAFGAAYRGTKALIEPLSRGGQERIAGRALRKFAGDSSDEVAAALQNTRPLLPGSRPTTAEIAGRPGISTLQENMRALSPEFAESLNAQQAANRAARIAALQGIAKDDAAMLAAEQAREGATSAAYNAAKRAVIEGDEALDGLLQRPLIKDGTRFAEEIARNEGRTFALSQARPAQFDAMLRRIAPEPAKYSGQTMHDLKLGIDKAFSTDVRTGAARRVGASEIQAKKAFLDWLEAKLPEYGVARKEFERLSKPINQMQIGRALLDKLRPALAEFGANSRETASTFGRAVKDADAVAAKATGFARAKAADVLEPSQMQTIENVAKDLARKANADDMARANGSNTARNLATQNILRQIFGPVGLPEAWSEAALLQTVMKPLNLVYSGVGEPRIGEALARGLLQPEEAARLMTVRGATPRLGLLNYAPVSGVALGQNVSQK